MTDLTNPIFNDADKAHRIREAMRVGQKTVKVKRSRRRSRWITKLRRKRI